MCLDVCAFFVRNICCSDCSSCVWALVFLLLSFSLCCSFDVVKTVQTIEYFTLFLWTSSSFFSLRFQRYNIQKWIYILNESLLLVTFNFTCFMWEGKRQNEIFTTRIQGCNVKLQIWIYLYIYIYVFWCLVHKSDKMPKGNVTTNPKCTYLF